MSPAAADRRPSSQSFKMSAPDPRADGGVRQITLSARGVRIGRQIAGMRMLLAVPIDAYVGVILTCDETVEPRLYRIHLAHPDSDLSVELHCAAESPGLVSIWRNWAAFFGKSPISGDMGSGGAWEFSRLGPPRPRRRGDPVPKRRPRFLKRRSCGGRLAKRAGGGGQLALG